MNDKVKLKVNGMTKEYSFEHALAILRTDKYKAYTVVGNHEFKDNELIIKPSKRGRKKSTKSSGSKEGDGLREQAEDIDPSV